VMIGMARQCQGFARQAQAGRRKKIHEAGTHSRSRRSSLSPTRSRAAGTAPQRRTDIRGGLGAALRPCCALGRMKRPEKITVGEMRSSGVRGVLVYCADYHCSHSIAIGAD
jgi:hypothetical protein